MLHEKLNQQQQNVTLQVVKSASYGVLSTVLLVSNLILYLVISAVFNLQAPPLTSSTQFLPKVVGIRKTASPTSHQDGRSVRSVIFLPFTFPTSWVQSQSLQFFPSSLSHLTMTRSHAPLETRHSFEVKCVNKVLNRVKMLLPMLLKKAVKRYNFDDFISTRTTPISPISKDVIHDGIANNDARLIDIERKLANIISSQADIQSSKDAIAAKVSVLEDKLTSDVNAPKPCANSTQITALQAQLLEAQNYSAALNTTLTEEIKQIKGKTWKTDEIERSQQFLSDQFDSLSRAVDDHKRMVSDLERDLRNETNNGLTILEGKLLKENEKVKSIAETSKKDLLSMKDQIKTDQKSEMEDIKERFDIDEQYSRRNCLEIHGVYETPGENTNAIAMDIFRMLNVKVEPSNIDRSHRLRVRRGRKNIPRPIIIKLVNYDLRQQIYERRDMLRRDPALYGIYINENLTGYRKAIYRKVRSLQSCGWSTWTKDGVICICDGKYHENAKVHYITHFKHLENFMEKIGRGSNPTKRPS